MNKPTHIVFASHGQAKGYLFVVPSDEQIKRGDRLYVDTIRGESEATADCDSFWVSKEQLDQIVPGTGAYWPIKSITGRQVAISSFQKVPLSSNVGGIPDEF